jgi:SAM-dependent methyltransferase
VIKSTIHRIVANPRVYDAVQAAVGARLIEQRMQTQLEALSGSTCVVDIGGGTGLLKSLFSEDCLYICLDIDPVKIDGYRDKDATGVAVLADATVAPILAGSVDLVVCKCLSHHIPPDRIADLFREGFRILKPNGTLLFVDAVRNEKRFRSKFMWRYDRGSFPRTIDEVRALLAQHGRIDHWEEFAYLHEYVLCLARRNDA